jgi:uncharacterized protein YegP (UPF0339 family)
MAKFKKGDRVINLKEENLIAKGAIGTVESEDTCPLVKWDEVKVSAKDDNYWFQNEEDLKLYDPNPATIEIYKSRGQFKFRVKGANGKTLNHLFNSKQGAKKGIAALAKALSNYKVIDLTK